MDNQLPKITMYTTDWCPYCVSTKRFLNNKGIPFEEINVEQDDLAAEFVMNANGGNRTVPTLNIEGLGIYTNPSPKKLTELLQLAK
jgi:mycoredoxin